MIGGDNAFQRAPTKTRVAKHLLTLWPRARQLGWVGAFLLILAALLFPSVLLASSVGHEIGMFEQAALILGATMIIQKLRGESLWCVIGRPGLTWLKDLARGGLLGAALMLIPAAALFAAGIVDFAPTQTRADALAKGVLIIAGAALAEELLFRGLLFQRLIEAIGEWPAQLAIAALFTITHLGNPGMVGTTKALAGANIFIASLMFGFAFLRTRSLGLPLGLHFMANVTQGMAMGFGVSGLDQPALLKPVFTGDLTWVSGGAFGLEASAPGLLAVGLMALLLARAPGR